MPVTIDNLGPESSRKYAEGQAQLDQNLIKDSQAIPARTGVSVLKPSFPRELDLLLHAQPTTITWAMTPPPKNYYSRANTSYLLEGISMNLAERLDAQNQKISETPLRLGDNPEDHAKAQSTLKKCLMTLHEQQQMIIETNSKRGQYQKG